MKIFKKKEISKHNTIVNINRKIETIKKIPSLSMNLLNILDYKELKIIENEIDKVGVACYKYADVIENIAKENLR